MDNLTIGALALAGAGALWGASAWWERRRRHALYGLGRQMDFRFLPPGGNNHRFDWFDAFNRGQRRRRLITLEGALTVGDQELPVHCGDFEFEEWQRDLAGKDHQRKRRRRFSYILVETPWRYAPTLLIRPEGFLDKAAGALGFDDIDFESAEFSRRFHVSSSDKRFAYDLLTARAMNFLLKCEPPPPMRFENGVVLVYSGDRRWPPERFREWITVVRTFLRQWPEHVVVDQFATS